MNVTEIVMTVLNGLLEHFNCIITALDAIGQDLTSLDFVKNRLLQEEQRNSILTNASYTKSALLNSTTTSRTFRLGLKCSHCGRSEHCKESSWKKFPSLRTELLSVPIRDIARTQSAFINNVDDQTTSEEKGACLLAGDFVSFNCKIKDAKEGI